MDQQKRVKITAEENKLLLRAKMQGQEDYKVQLKYAREKELRTQEVRIVQREREIEYKQSQIDSGKSLEKHDNFLDGIKPLFMLKNDLEDINADVAQMKEQIKQIKEVIKNDADRDKASS